MQSTTEDGILSVTFDRPESMNAFNGGEAAALADAVAEADPETHDAVVLTGEGEAFSAGGDIEAMAEREERPREAYERYNRTYGRVAEELFDCPVPVVAKINGDAVGAGLAVTALSDFAYAVEGATFGCAFVHVGLIPDTGGSYLLPKLVGLRAAKRLAFTGEYFDASEAAELGLITEAVEADDLDRRVSTLLETLADRPTETIALAKQAIHDNLGHGWDDALDHETMLQIQAYGSQAHEDGVGAFLDDE
ncbi:2-(1,2-epoxy-1,2-dihydrophenyl)acetyl-CoA isomerase [Halovenus aranensis]|uniref:2-(1,2-epoxy-1,2-dihydrophenyl)acetyl-CoA isomerase n=1 Tax=Halovenus aranensis TaxID=890420 RepID=A0A1G8Y7K9_9EURY|nr:enoyl-CoA hydratase/isomerase family protein [Halovenus aranensis]SDJ98434.1 2-(1,2-epoxy-1,2-dihydrophenyl)acetyl-CoA isomerase [Halovenus aranensis]